MAQFPVVFGVKVCVRVEVIAQGTAAQGTAACYSVVMGYSAPHVHSVNETRARLIKNAKSAQVGGIDYVVHD